MRQDGFGDVYDAIAVRYLPGTSCGGWAVRGVAVRSVSPPGRPALIDVAGCAGNPGNA